MDHLQRCFSSLSLANQHQLSIGAECWVSAEQSSQEILSVIQPTVVSEQRRMVIIDYVQRLIRDYYGTQVLPFGSVPLKTYLPDGDIDLTVVSNQNNEDHMARDICNILEGEEQRGTRFLVRGVRYIPAQVDQLIGKDHLFKRSILLIKAWCHYESRILGAQYGLISTYALDVMILYLINMFNSSLESPLAVLYKFLDYYNTFEWERYCITIYGRVAIPSLPNIVVENEEGNGCDLLLTKEFLENCVQYFSIPTRATETGDQFPVKHINIMDPLKSNNNLGRSVNRGSFYRIKSALNLGTRTLKQVLMGPVESINAELKKFFRSTLDRNTDRRRPDVQIPVFGDVRIHGISNSGQNYGNIHGPSSFSIPVPTLPCPHISHPRAQNPTPCVQYRWTDFSRTMLNEFIPREISHQIASRLLSSPFGVQVRDYFLTRGLPPSQWRFIVQNAMERASGTYVPNMGAESPFSRGTGTFIPTLTVREQLVPRGTGTDMPVMGALNLEGTGNYSTHVGADEKLKCQGTSTSINETGMVGMADWQGLGTFIADMSYIDTDSWDYRKKRVVEWVEVDLEQAQNEEYESCFDLSKEEFSYLLSSKRALASESGPSGAGNEGCSSGTKMALPTHGHHSVQATPETEVALDELPLLPTKSEHLLAAPPEGLQSAQPPVVESEDKAGSSGSFFKLSLEEFPLLPSRKKAVAPQTREPLWPTAAAWPSEAAQKSSPHHLEVFRHSPSPPPSSPETKEPDSGVTTPVGPITGFSTAAAPGLQLEPSDSNEAAVVAEGYQLEDETDFPPLGL